MRHVRQLTSDARDGSTSHARQVCHSTPGTRGKTGKIPREPRERGVDAHERHVEKPTCLGVDSTPRSLGSRGEFPFFYPRGSPGARHVSWRTSECDIYEVLSPFLAPHNPNFFWWARRARGLATLGGPAVARWLGQKNVKKMLGQHQQIVCFPKK